MTNYAVEARGLGVHKGHRQVLHDIAMTVAPGEIVGLLGPSGSGKTTLIRSIAGLQKIGTGSIRVLDSPAGSRGLRSRVGYVTQAPSVYEDLTIAQNLAYFARILGTGTKDIDRVLQTTQLVDHRHQLVRLLSGGQRNRVSLAAALIGEPALLLLDEPTVGLDPLLREELWDLFAELAARGTALLVSSHVMDEAARCDRLVLLRDGGVLADGTLADLRARTGAADAEGVFLTLVCGRAGETQGAGAPR